MPKKYGYKGGGSRKNMACKGEHSKDSRILPKNSEEDTKMLQIIEYEKYFLTHFRYFFTRSLRFSLFSDINTACLMISSFLKSSSVKEANNQAHICQYNK